MKLFEKWCYFAKKKKKIHVIAYKEAIVIIIIGQSLVTKFGCSLRLKLPLKN